MKFPLRSLAAVAAGLIWLGLCFNANAAGRPPAGGSYAGPQEESENQQAASSPQDTAVIPGPLRSFLRMAGISQEITSDQVLPMLARNVSVWGYENGKPTEFLILVNRYVHLARELHAMAGADGVIRVSGCSDAGPLVHVLGYEFHGTCGQKNAFLVTANAERAFLTVDSGFPLTKLEEALQNGTPFAYSFPATQVPMISTLRRWNAASDRRNKSGEDMVDILLRDADMDHLYSALARVDRETELSLVRSPGLRRLLPDAGVLDFYGSQICIHSNEVTVPGGAQAEAGWRQLVGASPRSPGEFVSHLLSKDHGWLAAYFDALARVSFTQQTHLTREPRLRLLYDAYRTAGNGADAAASVFPKNAGLLLLLTRLQWEANGELEIPGNLSMWRDTFARELKVNGYHDKARRSRAVDSPEALLEALVGSSVIETPSGPAQIYLMLSAIDRGRSSGRRISDNTAELLATRFAQFNDWYPIFAEFPNLDDGSIARFIEAADHIDGISNQPLRVNALGAFQANVGLWQIFARQGQIPDKEMNSSWENLVRPFDRVGTSVELFDASRSSLKSLLLTAGGSRDLTEDQIVDLLAGPLQSSQAGRRVHEELAGRIRSVLEDQRLVSLDTLFGLFDGLNQMAHGASIGDSLLPLAGDLREFEMPRPIFTGSEKMSWSPLVYSNRHAELQVRTDLSKVIRSPGSPAQLEDARGRLTPFLRDTLVGLNYAYYEPPGAQVLQNNPLFVRSHDFSAESVQGVKDIWAAPESVGIGVTAGGGAFLMGSLADLPYALSSMEEDFIAPTHVQALIWKETVPVLLAGAVEPRWWTVTRNELHAVDLYQRAGEELLTAAETNAELRAKVLGILANCMSTGRLARIEETLREPENSPDLLFQTLPADTFYLAAEFRKRFPDQASQSSQAARELDELAQRDPTAVDPERLKRDFGAPHPAMAESDASTLLFTGPFPVSGGYTNRLFGESWESTNLYWARVADEMGYPPVMLNILVPELTRHMVANIFGTSIDDWPALRRAMMQTGEEFRQGKIAIEGTGLIASN